MSRVQGQVTSQRGIAMSETFGAWELLSRLGHNELGQTDLARCGSDSPPAALKRFTGDTTGLKAELAAAAQLKHPAIAAVLEQGEVGGVAFAAMEYVDGVSLARLIAAAKATEAFPLSVARAVQLLRPVLDGLGAAHALSPPLLHRDLVPENILVTREGRVVLTDLGLGRARLRAGGGSGLRRAYVSVEQARGNPTDARSEVFSAGLLLFELVCGRLPAQGGAGEVISRIATGELDAPRAVNPKLDDATVEVLVRALQLSASERFPSAAEFSAALAALSPAPPEEPLGAWAGRLAAVKVAAPAPAPKPVVEQPPPPVIAIEPPAAPRPRASLPPRMRLVLGAVAVIVYGVLEFVDLRQLMSTPATPGRPLELTTVPSGAQVFVDGVLEARRTPMTLQVPKDEFRSLMLKKPGQSPAWNGVVLNVRKLEVTLASGETVEERYDGQRPRTKAAQPAAPPPVIPNEPPGPPPQEVVFDAESPPVEVVLTRAHSVRGDTAPSLMLAEGARVSLGDPTTVFISPSTAQFSRNAMTRGGAMMKNQRWVAAMNNAGTLRILNLFALFVSGGVVEVFDLSKPLTVVKPGPYYFFAPTESGEISGRAIQVEVDDHRVTLKPSCLLRVESIDSFLVRVLQPHITYRLELTRADGSAGPLPPVLMSLRTDDLRNRSMRQASGMFFDGEDLPSGQAIAGPGVHTLSGARNVWFSLVTSEGVVPADVKLSLRPFTGSANKPKP